MNVRKSSVIGAVGLALASYACGGESNSGANGSNQGSGASASGPNGQGTGGTTGASSGNGATSGGPTFQGAGTAYLPLTPGCGPETASQCTGTCEAHATFDPNSVIRAPATLCFTGDADPTPDDPLATRPTLYVGR